MTRNKVGSKSRKMQEHSILKAVLLYQINSCIQIYLIPKLQKNGLRN